MGKRFDCCVDNAQHNIQQLLTAYDTLRLLRHLFRGTTRLFEVLKLSNQRGSLSMGLTSEEIRYVTVM